MEIARRMFRGLLGANSSAYRFATAVLNFLVISGKEGVGTWARLHSLQRREGNSATALRFSALAHPFMLRPGLQDAVSAINGIVREEWGQFSEPADPRWMIDAGAYIGDTAAYFASRFPRLRVLALEPNPPSFELASKNLAPYGDRVTLIPKGLAATESRLRFGGEFTAASIQADGFEIECTTLPHLMQQYGMERIDILKMDIEGGEGPLFSASPEVWLDRVGLLIIELHSPELTDLVSRVLHANGFTMRRFRSVWYCTRNPA